MTDRNPSPQTPLPMGEGLSDKPVMRGERRVLCHVEEIGEAGKGFVLTGIYKERPNAIMPVFLVTDGDAVHCYMNMCPHQGITLEMKPDTFLDVERALIQCSTHGAKFRKDDGYCTKGPCVGRSLTKLPVTIDDDGMILFGA
jgi:nitrite reductase/ring-hydroxylating ferredoxin subunit